MDNYEEDEKIEARLTEINRKSEESDVLAFRISEQVMEDYGAGFVIVGSPILISHEKGFKYPESCGVIINSSIDFSKTELARTLMEIAIQLNADMAALTAFVNETTAKDENDESDNS